MRLKILVLVLLASLMVARAAWSGAYSSGYEPLTTAKLFPMRECALEGQDYVCHSKTGISRMVVQDSWVEVWRGESLKARVRLGYDMGFDYVLESDLNRDGLPDYLLVQPSGGNGLASEYCHAIFVLSAKSGYVMTKLNTMGFDPKDLLQLETGQASVIHTWFIDSEEKTRDGKYHSFWVYHFLKVRGTTLVLDSSRKSIWIQYRFKPNHTPTKLISSEQKKRWWNRQKEPMFIR